MAAIQGVAPGFGVELHPLGVRDASEIERAITAFARSNGGLITTANPFHRWICPFIGVKRSCRLRA
jgi:hypothetical protein